MLYLFVGDTHGENDLGKLRSPEVAGLRLTGRDAVIHCGDFGAPWGQDDDAALRWWRALPCKTLICLGNHENYGWINHQPVLRRYGCLGRDLGGRLFAPLPGETAQVGGRRFWFYPGGYSVDYFLRRPGQSLFEDELLPPAQAERILRDYARKPVPDYVVSHDGPRAFILKEFGFPILEPPAAYFAHTGQEPGSRAHPAFMLDRVYRSGRFRRWYFGHHHRDLEAGNVRCLWRQTLLEDSLTGERRVIEA